MKGKFHWLAFFVLAFAPGSRADDSAADDPVEQAASKTVRESYRTIDTDAMQRLPIGVFDSGTGGLAVLETILTLDAFENDSHSPAPQGDGQRDFNRESFLFLADQANMPYGNYPVVGKEDLLDDLIVKDALFLMGRDCFRVASPDRQPVLQNKLPVKAIVIACNTATAFGQSDIERVIANAGVRVKVIGVIEAGAKGAVQLFQDGKPGTIAVVPTQGTVMSGAYPVAVQEQARAAGLQQRIDVFQQGAFGLAGAIDGASEFISLDAKTHTAREDYRGPSFSNRDAPIDRRLLGRYHFDFAHNGMLYSGSADDMIELQMNSVRNYISYNLVTLLEQIRARGDAPPLRAIILGCTHFPFYEDEFRQELDRLRDYQEDGRPVYLPWMAERIELIDPSFFAARELYASLVTDRRLQNADDETKRPASEFFLTIPCRERSDLPLGTAGWFTYDHKYGRKAGNVQSDFRPVPMDSEQLDQSVLERLQSRVPTVWKLLAK